MNSLLKQNVDELSLPTLRYGHGGPFGLMGAAPLVVSEHPLAALSHEDPGLAAGVMHDVISVEHRRVDLEFARFEWEKEREERLLEAQEVTQRFNFLFAVMEKFPDEREYEVSDGGFFFRRTTRVRIGGRDG
ncbi:MAG: hypothetical protein WBD36_04245 [Bacteroidota bacterium]